MKIYNLGRGKGKTTKLIYISEYTGAPILCFNQQRKRCIQQMAQDLGAMIPEPLTLENLYTTQGKRLGENYLVDEAIYFLKMMILKTTNGMLNNPLALSLNVNDE